MTRFRGDEELCIAAAASSPDRAGMCQSLERRRHVSICSLSRMSETSDVSMEDLTRSDDMDIADLSPWYYLCFCLVSKSDKLTLSQKRFFILICYSFFTFLCWVYLKMFKVHQLEVYFCRLLELDFCLIHFVPWLEQKVDCNL